MRVAVAMSGGVDSSVAASILKEQGYEVIGLTMKLWDDGSRCCSGEDAYDAKKVAEQFKIPHYTLNFKKEFEEEVVNYFVNEYLMGRTPNPCVVCNRKIKFGLLLQRANEIGAEYLATGHYVRIVPSGGLKRAKDKQKDQSYFLGMIPQENLSKLLFPLGDYTKEEVRELALQLGLKIAEKEESQEICFIPDGDYVSFIKTHISSRILRGKTQNIALRGPIIDKDGNVIGYHKGLVNYTIGQRSGLGIKASNPFSKPFYVIGINPDENAIIVGKEEDLLCKSMIAEGVNWIRGQYIEPLRCEVQVRYRALPAKALLIPKGDEILIEFDTPQKSITPGQLAVFYKNDTVLGSAWIKTKFP